MQLHDMSSIFTTHSLAFRAFASGNVLITLIFLITVISFHHRMIKPFFSSRLMMLMLFTALSDVLTGSSFALT